MHYIYTSHFTRKSIYKENEGGVYFLFYGKIGEFVLFSLLLRSQ